MEQNEDLGYGQFQLFEIFQRLGGVQRLIEVLLKCLTQWKNKDRSQKWFMWVKVFFKPKELASFSELPSFFSLFIKNKVCIDLLFKILSQEPDNENDKDKIKKVLLFTQVAGRGAQGGQVLLQDPGAGVLVRQLGGHQGAGPGQKDHPEHLRPTGSYNQHFVTLAILHEGAVSQVAENPN